ncbi:MAG: preprotein translocase subunit SecG [Gammaproteobacteria bacterium]|nr:preprotein translocase subunit SecG [Gammaproteobacteria bacterium]
MESIVWSIHVIAAVVMVVMVLLQQGKGADMGAAFGSGSAGSVFGASGSANFMSRTTALIATVFFCTSLGLTYISTNRTEDAGVMSRMGEMIEASESQSTLTETEAESEQDEEPVSEIPGSEDSSNAGRIPD